MQLDRTHVVIRPRSLAEIGDLALMLVRRYPQALLIGFTAGVLPWIILNALLLAWIPLAETSETVYDEETIMERYRYVWLMSVLVFLQTPLAGAFTTSYIGQAVFEHRPTWRSVLRDTMRIFWRVTWVLGVVRGPLPAMLLLLFTWGQPFSPGVEVGWMILIILYVMILRSIRPFMPEILLLERCRIFARGSDAITLSRRSALLHGPISGDLIGRFVFGSILLGMLAVACFAAGVFFTDTLLNSSKWSLFTALVLVPGSLWIAAGFSVIIRFLSYLDSRIRLEGWEVELMLRAEAQRQFGTLDGGLAQTIPTKKQVVSAERLRA